MVIAHRIQTVMDSHRLIILSKGKVVEQGTPDELARMPDSAFSKMIRA